MAAFLSDYRSPVKLAILAVLLVACVWLVWRNLLAPVPQSAGIGQGTQVDAARGTAATPSGRRGRPSGDALADYDPTLRLDLLEAARKVEYRGSARNIFQAYTPPPPPMPPPPPPPPPTAAARTPVTPPAASIPLKFYGTAQRPGSQPRKAFLIDGEEIFIAQEGDIVAKFYKVIRIGPSSIELEDTRSRQRQQLPLIEE